MPSQTSTLPPQTERIVFGDEAAQLLAQQLRDVALMDPVEVLERVTEGHETLLPKFRASATEVPKLKPWDAVQRASPQPLSATEYWKFLQGDFQFSEDVLPATDQAILTRAIIPYLRESSRDELITGITAIVSAVVSGLVAFEVIGTGWLSIIAAVYGVMMGAETFFIGSRMRSLKEKAALARGKSRVNGVRT